MILRIFDTEGKAVAGFDKYRELCITYTLDISDKVMSFEADISDIQDIMQTEGYIETPDDRFVIKEIENNSDGTANVIAQLDLEALEGKAHLNFESVEQTIQAALQLAFANTGWIIKTSNVTKKRTLRMTHVSALDILKQALKTYRCEILIDSKNHSVIIYEKIGDYKGIYFKSDLNLTELTVQTSSYDFYTEIEPIGKDGITIADVNGGVTYLTNYEYSQKKKRLIWKDERYTVLESLKEDAQAKLNDMAKPYVSYAGKVIDLARANNIYSALDFSIGDTVDIIDIITGTKEQQRIVGLKVYPDEYWRNELTYANKVLTFDEMVQKYDYAASTVDNITSDNGTVDGSTVDAIKSKQIVDLENAIVENAYISNLSTDFLNVSRRLTAVEGSFGQLEANVAYIDQLNAVYGTIENLDSKYATIENLSATNASIDTLEADYANINHLLAGNAGIGELQSIHLTAANTTISQGFIDTLTAQIAVIKELIAGRISTEGVTIGSADGGLAIAGNLIQFKDKNGVVRIQIGKDAKGNFTFVLYDETGKGQLLNADGVTASAIADGLIVDAMVADNAGISAEKLDIASLFRVINDNGTELLKANRIYFDDEGQTLNQIYIQMSQSIESVEGTIDNINETATTAQNSAQKAIETAENALLALSGITTIDALSAQLTNDAHVVHTDFDGTGGDFTYAKTQIICFMGDTDISDHVSIEVLPSDGVTGTWNNKTRVYQVTALDTLNGYVDFDIAYGDNFDYLQTPDGSNILMPDGSKLTIKNGTVHINKRFSISKSPDGQAGVSYNLMASVDAIRRKANGTLNPETITFTANKAKGDEIIAYSGRFKIEVSTDGKEYTQVYMSSTNELSKSYNPPTNTLSIKCTLYDENNVMLDMQSVIVIADADELAGELATVKESVATFNTTVTEISTGVEGFKTKLGNIQTQIYGLSDGDLMVNVGTSYTGTSRVYTAYVYRGLEDIKTQFDKGCFAWSIETAEGEEFLGYGYSITVADSKIDRDGCVKLDFVTTGIAYLQTPNGKNILTPDGKYITISCEDIGQFARKASYDDIPGDETLAATQSTQAASLASNKATLSNIQSGLLNATTKPTALNSGIQTTCPIITLGDNDVNVIDEGDVSDDDMHEALEASENEMTEISEVEHEEAKENLEEEYIPGVYLDDDGNPYTEDILEKEIDSIIGSVITELIEDAKALSLEYEFDISNREEVTDDESNGKSTVL